MMQIIFIIKYKDIVLKMYYEYNVQIKYLIDYVIDCTYIVIYEKQS